MRIETVTVQSNFNNSNFLWTMKICSRYRYFEPLRVIHDARSESKGDNLEIFFYLVDNGM